MDECVRACVALRSGFFAPGNSWWSQSIHWYLPRRLCFWVVQIYVCTDVENNLAELRFYCDPDNDGDAQCYAEAGVANVRALEIHVSFEFVCFSLCRCFVG